MCRHRLSQEETEGGCACVPRVVRDARDWKDAQDAHLVRLVSLNQPSFELCGGSSQLNGRASAKSQMLAAFSFWVLILIVLAVTPWGFGCVREWFSRAAPPVAA